MDALHLKSRSFFYCDLYLLSQSSLKGPLYLKCLLLCKGTFDNERDKKSESIFNLAIDLKYIICYKINLYFKYLICYGI